MKDETQKHELIMRLRCAKPDVVKANKQVLSAGHSAGEAREIFTHALTIPPKHSNIHLPKS